MCFPLGNTSYFFFFDTFWVRALPAALFEDLLVLPSRNTDEALLATFLDVVFLGAFVWLNALPAAALDFLPVLFDRRTFDAFLAALGRVTFFMCHSSWLIFNN